MNNPDKSAATERVEKKIDDVTTRSGSKYGNDDGESHKQSLESEQRREAGEAWAGPGVPASSDGQAKGLVVGSLLGGAIGLVLLLPFGFIPIGGLSLAGRLILCAIVGALAGGTAGALYFGGRVPELQGETMDADGRPSVGSTLRDPRSDSRGR